MRRVMLLGLTVLLAACATARPQASSEERAQLIAKADSCKDLSPGRYHVDRWGDLHVEGRGSATGTLDAGPFFNCVFGQGQWRHPSDRGVTTTASKPPSPPDTGPAQPSTPLPLPADLRVILPGPDVPAAVAGLSGRWRGAWNDNARFPTMLVVEQMSAAEAVVVISLGFGSSPSWFRVRAQVEKEELRATSGDVRFTYRQQPDGSVFGTMEHKTNIFRGRLIRSH